QADRGAGGAPAASGGVQHRHPAVRGRGRHRTGPRRRPPAGAAPDRGRPGRSAVGAMSGQSGGTFRNPVLPGCHPDPSICRVGDDYYLVTSTFEYFPGLPVFTSRDLVTWRQVGHVVSRTDQVDLSTVPSSGGLFAAT